MEESTYDRLFSLAEAARDALDAHEQQAFLPEIARRLSERTGKPEKPLSTTECHVLDRIWKGTTTAARIAESLGMTRGGVSKAVAKLEAKGFLASERSAESAREVVLSLTPRGQIACEEHAQMRLEAARLWSQRLSGFTEEEIELACRFLEAVAQADGEKQAPRA